MLVFNASAISLTQRAPALPPSPELSPLCQRLASLRRSTKRWLEAVTGSKVVERIQSVTARIQAVRRRSRDEKTTSLATPVDVQDESDALSLASQATSHDHETLDVIVIKSTSFVVPSSEASEPGSDVRSVMRRTSSLTNEEGEELLAGLESFLRMLCADDAES